MMLVQLLQKHRIGARVVSSREASPANILRLEPGDVKIVCLAYLEPAAVASARYLVRRVRRRLPQARVGLGLWGRARTEGGGDNTDKQLEADFVVTSLEEAVERIGNEVGAAIPKSPVETSATTA